MFTPEKKSIVELLIALAWADGRVDEKEMDIVRALLDGFNASADDRDALMTWAKKRRDLGDVDISALERSDLHLALQYGILLTYIDGEQTEDEVALVNQLIGRLGLTPEEAAPLVDSASEFAKSLLPELES